MEKNNLKVGANNHSETRKKVSTKKASMEVPAPNSNKVNSAVSATKDFFIMESCPSPGIFYVGDRGTWQLCQF